MVFRDNADGGVRGQRRTHTRRSTGRLGKALGPLAFIMCLAALTDTSLARCIPVAQRNDMPQPSLALHRVPIETANRPRSQIGARPLAARIVPVNEKSTVRGPALARGEVMLTFLGHSTFLIRTVADVAAVTDYNSYVRAPFAPDIVTMNRAHDTHYTNIIEPGVKHVLRGWMEKGVIPRHNVTVKDLHVSNVPTNIRGALGGDTGFAGNSIFIFRSAGVCVVHLGHLHHRLTTTQVARVGIVDVLLAPIDDSWTMAHTLLVKVIEDLDPRVVIPMHYGFGGTLDRFIALMQARKFEVRRAKGSNVRFTKASLPGKPTVLVLQSAVY